jgi:AcrR family transcriptional regulator
VPKLWSTTIASHRREVRDAITDAAASLVASRGLRGITMSEIAETTGIGRATLYKYFPSVEAILVAWHEQQLAVHLQHMAGLRDAGGDAVARLENVLEAYALIQHEHRSTQLAALLHRGEHVVRAQQQLTGLIRDLLQEARQAGDVRDDVPSEELAAYCLHALAAASDLASKAAVRRLVAVTLAGVRTRGR